MIKPTKGQMATVLKNLQKERDTIPEFSAFGDHNWDILDDQIHILSHVLNYGCYPLEYDREDDHLYDLFEWLEQGDEGNDFGSDYYN